jgi:hypothetical protein
LTISGEKILFTVYGYPELTDVRASEVNTERIKGAVFLCVPAPTDNLIQLKVRINQYEKRDVIS